MDEATVQAIAARAAEEALARFGAHRAPARAPAPVTPSFGELHKFWVTSHDRLASFACDNQRALRILGAEPFELRHEDGTKRLASWAPSGGPLHERAVANITGDDVDEFRAWYYAQTTRRKSEPSPATVNRYVMMLKRILNHAVKRRKIERSPLLGYEEEEEDDARQVVLEEEDLELLLTAFGDDVFMRAFVLLGYDSGMRLTELLCCRWRWFDERAGTVQVPGAVAKNGETRWTDLSIRALAGCKLLPRTIRKDRDFVFPNPDTGEPYNKRWIHERFVRGVAAAGLVGRDGTPPRIHDLRRSFITLMDRRGVPRKIAMMKSGHLTEAAWRRYRIGSELESRQAWVTMEAGRQADLAALAERRAGDRGPDNSRLNVGAGKVTGE